MNYIECENLFKNNESEQDKRKKLKQLFDNWRKIISDKPKIQSPLIKEGEYVPEYLFTDDGFYPGYFSSNTKVLFIGREGRYAQNIARKDRIIFDLEVFNNRPKDALSKRFWKRVLTLAYLIRNGQESISTPLNTVEILNKMNKEKNYGFAFMNLSKYLNPIEEKSGRVNAKLIKRFLDDSELDKYNFIKEEIKILNPNLIITSNLWNINASINNYLNQIFSPIEALGKQEDNGQNACLLICDFDGIKIPRVDIHHFSASSIPAIDLMHFYIPIIELLLKRYNYQS